MCFTFVDFKVETFYVVSTMLDIHVVDHNFQNFFLESHNIMYTVYQNEVLCIFFLDDVNEYYYMKNSWLRYNFVLKMIDFNPDYLSER